ncbi:DUF937 domain-containing protein [Sphingomonas sp. RB1R13]|uniref:DUF937 domain-containing protein n=1 Tax=Sphingomonas sp. RB1R13 TaxID=3096159 RepID=UPI002FC9AF11
MDIGSILAQAGGVGAIARQLGVDESTVESGVGALLPHVENGIQQQGLPGAVEGEASSAPDPQDSGLGDALGGMLGGGGLGGLLGGLMGGGGAAAGGGGGGGILGSLVSGGVGNEILGHIFGSKDVSRDVATQASQQSGVDTSVLKKLLPIVAGAVAMHYMTRRGQGGAAPADADAGGGGILGSILGGR